MFTALHIAFPRSFSIIITKVHGLMQRKYVYLQLVFRGSSFRNFNPILILCQARKQSGIRQLYNEVPTASGPRIIRTIFGGANISSSEDGVRMDVEIMEVTWNSA